MSRATQNAWERARDRLYKRARAAAGVEPDYEGVAIRAKVIPSEIARRTLHGFVPEDAMDEALVDLMNAAENLMLGLEIAEDREEKVRTMFGMLAQSIAMGVLVEREQTR